jgi:sec-independent protein translocase protein TatC
VATTLRPIRHEDRLSLVEHLDELRKRIIVCVIVFVACFGLCLWQDDVVLDIVNRPLENTAFKDTKSSKDPFERTAAFQAQLRKSALASAASYDDLAQASDEPAIRRGYQQLATSARALARSVPPQEAKRPVTLGVGEPFTATVRIAGYAALLIALPFLLYQAYAFVLPAFSREERSVALPLMAMVPFLFIAGVVFAYYMVLPNAINFLQNFNDDNFDILLQAKDYYRFSITVLIAMGLCFQVPVGILACTRLGIITVAQLRQSRRYSILGIAVVAMLLPGQDPVTMLSLMIPLYVLFEGSILLAWLAERRAPRVGDDLEP